MQIATVDLELILSGRAAKSLRLKPVAPASAAAVHFLARWRIEIAEDAKGEKLFLVTNATTFFSILIPRVAKMSFEDLVEHFLMRLRFVLIGVNPPVEWKPGQARPVLGADRSLIGSMNNMVYLLSRGSSLPQSVHPEEDFLNNTPFLSLPEIFPRKAFFGRLGEIPPPARLFDFNMEVEEAPEMASGPVDFKQVMRALEEDIAEDQGSPEQRAEQLYYDAMDAPSSKEEFVLLGRALKIDPENAGALLAMLRHRKLPLTKKVEELRKILEIAERRLGPDVFESCKGHFWGHFETRPYMRTRAELAETLHSLGRSDEAIAEWQAMLELNPNDNQGIRYSLLPEFLARGNVAAACEIFSNYNECEFSTLFAWCRVLERFISDDEAGAKRALIAARKQNASTEVYITGAKRLPKTTYPAYSPGSREEAVCFAESLRRTWAKHPEAVKWLIAQRKPK